MKRTWLALALIAVLVAGLSLSACTGRKMRSNERRAHDSSTRRMTY